MGVSRRLMLWWHGLSEADAAFIASREWLDSRQWAGVRHDCIEYYRARCIACGRSPQKDGIRINLDHQKPRKTHPWLATKKGNIVPRCDLCNKGKANKKATDWREGQGYWRHLWLAIKG